MSRVSVKARLKSGSAPPEEAARRLAKILVEERYALGRSEVTPSPRELVGKRGSRFALEPDALRHTVRAAFPQGSGEVLLELEAAPFPWLSAKQEEALQNRLQALQEAFENTAPPKSPIRPRRRRSILASLLIPTGLAILATWAIGHRLILRDLSEIRAGHLSWDYYPAAENLRELPWTTPWVAGGFLAGTAGLALGLSLGTLLALTRFLPAIAESSGSLLGWASAFLVAGLATGPVPGGGVGPAASMLDPVALGLLGAVPWASWLLQSALESRRRREPAGISKALSALLVAAAALLLPAATLKRPREAAAQRIADDYAFHRFRDLVLMGNAAGDRLTALYYRYTPYADLATSPALHPDRQSLRVCQQAGVLLWLAFPWILAAAAGGACASFIARGCPERARPLWTLAGALALPALLALLWPASPWGRLDAARRTGNTVALVEALRSGSGSLRAEAAHALSLSASPLEGPPLARGLEDPDPRVRLWSTTALGRLAAWEDFPSILRAAEKDPHFLVRSRAADACLLFAEDAASAPDGRLFETFRALAGAEKVSGPARRALAAMARERLSRSAGQEPFIYVRRRLLLASKRWEEVQRD